MNYPKTTTWTITRRLVITVLDTMTRKLQLHPVSRHGVVWLPWKLVIFLYVALSLLSLLSIHLQYYSVTMLEPLSVAGSHIPPRKYPRDCPKVAFLFLTRRDLPLDFMWDRFFKVLLLDCLWSAPVTGCFLSLQDCMLLVVSRRGLIRRTSLSIYIHNLVSCSMKRPRDHIISITAS